MQAGRQEQWRPSDLRTPPVVGDGRCRATAAAEGPVPQAPGAGRRAVLLPASPAETARPDAEAVAAIRLQIEGCLVDVSQAQWPPLA